MATFTVPSSRSAEGLLPHDHYPFEIFDARLTESPNEAKTPLIEFSCICLADGQYHGKQALAQVYLTEGAVWKLKKLNKVLGLPKDGKLDTGMYIGKRFLGEARPFLSKVKPFTEVFDFAKLPVVDAK